MAKLLKIRDVVQDLKDCRWSCLAWRLTLGPKQGHPSLVLLVQQEMAVMLQDVKAALSPAIGFR